MLTLLREQLAAQERGAMPERALRVAVVGCGNISGPYGETMSAYPSVRIAGATDVDRSLSAAFVDRFGGVVYPSLDDVLGRPERRCHRESHLPGRPRGGGSRGAPRRQARAQREAPRRELCGRPVACRARGGCGPPPFVLPITFMGEAQQTMWRLVESGAIGAVRVAYAEVNGNRIESWHPRPEPFYRIGPFADVGVYPLTILTAMFGPARRVTAFGRSSIPTGRTMDGGCFTPGGAGLRRRGRRARERNGRTSHGELYVCHLAKQGGIELHGDLGSILFPTGSSSTPRSSSLASASRTRPCPSRGRSPAPTGAVPSVT